jgi:hypothetical protein
LIARDAGCSFPGCTHPPQWCDRHHILDWILGGPTDLDNMTLLADITTPNSCRKAGPAASTPTGYPNGSHHGGSTPSSDLRSTPASDASTPNDTSTAADDHLRPPNRSRRHLRREDRCEPRREPRDWGDTTRPALKDTSSRNHAWASQIPGEASQTIIWRAVGGIGRGSLVIPDKYSSTPAAQARPSAIAQTISD